MSGKFYERLANYYDTVAKVLRGEAQPAAIFPNNPDKGLNREQVYCKFLKQHAPAKCSIKLGGFLFQEDGSESRQLDLIVITDTAPQFDFYHEHGGKTFACVEGALGVFSIKSYLDKNQLFEALGNLASIPPTHEIGGKLSSLSSILDYADWPYKFVYASDGMAPDTLLSHLGDYYEAHPEIPFSRRPNVIHIAGKAVVVRSREDGWNVEDDDGSEIPTGVFVLMRDDADVKAIMWTIHLLHTAAIRSTHLLYDNGPTLAGISKVLLKRRQNE
jgi:hypothetical protein